MRTRRVFSRELEGHAGMRKPALHLPARARHGHLLAREGCVCAHTRALTAR